MILDLLDALILPLSENKKKILEFSIKVEETEKFLIYVKNQLESWAVGSLFGSFLKNQIKYGIAVKVLNKSATA